MQGDLAGLVKEMDKVAVNKGMKAFVVFVGKGSKRAARAFAAKTPTKAIPYTAAKHHKRLNKKFNLSREASVTVLMYKHPVRGGVTVNHSFRNVDEKGISRVIRDTSKIVN